MRCAVSAPWHDLHCLAGNESMKFLVRTLGLAAVLATALALTVQAQTASGLTNRSALSCPTHPAAAPIP